MRTNAKEHLVARCPCCLRPIWTTRLVKLLGLDALSARSLVTDEVAFVAVSTSGRKGWRLSTSMQTLAEVVEVGGAEAVEQLRRLARQTGDALVPDGPAASRRSGARAGYMHHLAVASEVRRKGIATRLIERCLAELHARDVPKCNVFVFDEPTPREFWTNRGFRPPTSSHPAHGGTIGSSPLTGVPSVLRMWVRRTFEQLTYY